MFHLRFTPYDISGYTFDFLENYSRYIIAFEDKDKYGAPTVLHYHVLIDTDYGEKSVRDAIKASLKIPKSSRGKNNAYYCLETEWRDPGYICKYNDIRRSKGFSEKEIMEFVINGKKRYLDKVKGVELSGDSVAPATPPKQVPKVPFQQAVIADASADWYNYKKQCRDKDETVIKSKVVEFISAAMVKNGKGINQYLVKELAFAILHEDLDYRDFVLAKIKSYVDL